MNNLAKYIDNLILEFTRNYDENIQGCSEEEKLLYLFAYYHYFNADASKIMDIVQGNTCAGSSIDHISGVYLDADSDNGDVDVLVSEYCEGNEFDFPAILKIFKDVEAYVDAVQLKKIHARRELSLLSEEDYQVSSTKPLKIKMITNYVAKTVAYKRTITKALQALKPEHEYVSYSIAFGDDIEYEVLEIENPKEYVDEAIIELDKTNNILFFGSEKSLIVNASASSIKHLYEQYGYRGLFAQNLRYYVKNAKVDGNIINSIQEQPDNFWYFNNGIILICDDYAVRGDSMLVKNFSIINGGQTTKLIGETEFDNDFFVQCKVIKNKYEMMDERLEFIANVAEATNTQKPIKDKDLIANRIEQRLLKKQLAEAGVYCQIKRGEKVNKKLYPDAWQNTTNEELGQFLLSFVYQKPGIARGNKASICGNKERYSLLFGKKYNSDFLTDLLKIKAYYKLWANNVKKTDEGLDTYKVGLVNNGMFFVTSIIGVVCKVYYRPSLMERIMSEVMSEQKQEAVSQHDIDHHFLRVDIDKADMFALFEYCYKRFYRAGFEFLKSFKERYNNYSNFTKINNNYVTYVFKQFELEYRNGIPEKDKEWLSAILFEAKEEDIKRDEQLLEKYVNVVDTGFGLDRDVPTEVYERIKDLLISYRTKTYKLNRIKAYEVFKNISCERIAKCAPCSIEELKELRCLDEAQLTLYGEDIVDIVKHVVQEQN